MPCIADPDIVWEDHVSPAPFYGRVMGKIHSIVDPFVGPGLLTYRYSMQAGEKGFEISCQLREGAETTFALPGMTPHRIVTTLTSRFGIQRVEAQLGNDVKMSAELIGPEVPRQKLDAAHRHENPRAPFGITING